MAAAVSPRCVCEFPVRALRRAQVLHQLRRNLFQETRRHTGFGHIGSITAAIPGARENQVSMARVIPT